MESIVTNLNNATGAINESSHSYYFELTVIVFTGVMYTYQDRNNVSVDIV